MNALVKRGREGERERGREGGREEEKKGSLKMEKGERQRESERGRSEMKREWDWEKGVDRLSWAKNHDCRVEGYESGE